MNDEKKELEQTAEAVAKPLVGGICGIVGGICGSLFYNYFEENGEEKIMDIYGMIEKNINSATISEMQKAKLMKNLKEMKKRKINIMITGATGCGKSSTINALFETEVAKVGVGVDPETMDITKHQLQNLVLWDSPGLGDGKEADNRHAKNIINKLYEKDENGDLLIDLVLVILDGSTRDLGTSYELINEVIIPNLGNERDNRILVAINQADVAMKGKYWNHELNRPEEKLEAFLDEKVKSVRKRIKEGTGLEVDPIYYCAGYKEEGEEQQNPYNLTKLLSYIMEYVPKEKRVVLVENMNKQQEMWADNDDLEDYRGNILASFRESIADGISAGADIGGEIGSIFGGVGRAVGSVVGGAIGGVCGVVGGVLGSVFGGWF